MDGWAAFCFACMSLTGGKLPRSGPTRRARATADPKHRTHRPPDPNPPRPLAYHDWTGHVLPDGYDCPVQKELDSLVQYCDTNDMKINTNKTKVMIFSNSRNYDYMPKLHVQAGSDLEVVEQQKLLGIVIQSDLRWYANTQNMCEKGYTIFCLPKM